MLICVVAKSFFPRRCRGYRCSCGFVQMVAVGCSFVEHSIRPAGECSAVNFLKARRGNGSGSRGIGIVDSWTECRKATATTADVGSQGLGDGKHGESLKRCSKTLFAFFRYFWIFKRKMGQDSDRPLTQNVQIQDSSERNQQGELVGHARINIFPSLDEKQN